MALLGRWDDAAAALFTENVAWDRALDRRRQDIAQVRERIGDFRADPSRPAAFDTPAQCRWWLRGPYGAGRPRSSSAGARAAGAVPHRGRAVPGGPLSALVGALVSPAERRRRVAGRGDRRADVDTGLLLRQPDGGGVGPGRAS
jgi:hypothetical protein